MTDMESKKNKSEDISAEHIKEHYRRLSDFQGISKDTLKKRIREKAK